MSRSTNNATNNAANTKAVRSGRSERGSSRMFALGVLSAAAVTAGIFILRNQRQVPTGTDHAAVPGDASPSHISLERLRELGI